MVLQEKKPKTDIGVGIGIILQLIGRLLAIYGGGVGVFVGLTFILAGIFVFVGGCMNYAEGKGYSRVLGLLGLFSCIGLIILVFLPYKPQRTK
jgi:hypothetical protein